MRMESKVPANHRGRLGDEASLDMVLIVTEMGVI